MRCIMDEESVPLGMKVLVVDSIVCSKVLCGMLKRCGYEVTECEQHNEALKLLRELKFDLVISNLLNTSESDIDGLKLLEVVGLEMDLPLIFVSVNSKKETIMKAIQHGACDYLIKPVQMKDVETIWKHVIRRKNSILADPESCGSLEEKNNNESMPRKNDETSKDAVRSRKKKKREPTGEDDGELENGEEPTKKGRFNWNGERHKQFVAAVNQLGVDNAVPKKILNVLNIPGLKREHVASHLQKYRLGLRKAEKEKLGQQTRLINSPYGISLNPIMGPASMFSFQTLQPRPFTWNNHASNIISPLHTMPQIESSTNAPGFLADPHDMLWQVVASQSLPACPTSMNNSLLINQNYSYQNMQQGSNETLTMSNNPMGIGSSTSQAPSLASNNKGFNNNNYSGSLVSGFVQNSYSPALVGTDRIESPSSNLISGNSEEILNQISWDLDIQM